MADRKIFVSGDLTSDDKFKEAIEQVEKKGFIPSHRTGDTGVGKTLEDELGVEENSVQAADLGEVELKATRRDSNSKLTLFTKAPKKRGVNSRVLRAQYGYQTDVSRALNPNINILHTQVNGRDFNTLDGEPFLKLTTRMIGYIWSMQKTESLRMYTGNKSNSKKPLIKSILPKSSTTFKRNLRKKMTGPSPSITAKHTAWKILAPKE